MEQKKLLQKLMDRDITPCECMSKLSSYNIRNLERLITINQIPIKVRKNLSLNDIKTMNFIEVREYCKNKVNAGVDLNDLAMEIDIKWENNEISGFDYQYFKESVCLGISKIFITKAKSVGRYDK